MQVESFSVEHPLEAFSKINYKGFGNVTLKQGENPMVKIASKHDFQDAVKYDVLNGELRLRIKDGLSLGLKALMKLESPDLNIEIVYTALEQITFNGMGNLENDGVLEGFDLRVVNNGLGKVTLNVDVKTLNSKLDGAGQITLVGSAEEHSCNLNGAGKIEAKELQAENVKTVANGIGSVNIYASKKISAKLVGVGSIAYFGQPDKVESKIQGLGSILVGD